MRAAYDEFWKETRPLMVNEDAPMSPTRPFHVLLREADGRRRHPRLDTSQILKEGGFQPAASLLSFQNYPCHPQTGTPSSSAPARREAPVPLYSPRLDVASSFSKNQNSPAIKSAAIASIPAAIPSSTNSASPEISKAPITPPPVPSSLPPVNQSPPVSSFRFPKPSSPAPNWITC